MKLVPSSAAVNGAIIIAFITSTPMVVIAGAAALSITTTPTPTDQPACQLDYSKYNLSECTQVYLRHAAGAMAGTMTGLAVGDVSRKYIHCVVDNHATYFDWKWLCEGDGDSEPRSGIIDTALLAGHVGD